jgi:dTDP-4-dehydrorhamnose 3,5-epimerase
MIDGIKKFPLQKFVDQRGFVLKMLSRKDPYFKGFGEVYFSKINPGAIKAWHIHKKNILNYTVVWGNIKLVAVDLRKNSKTNGEINEIFIGDDNPYLVQIPPRIANGFMSLGNKGAIVANCLNSPHYDNEMERINPFDKRIKYDWLAGLYG